MYKLAESEKKFAELIWENEPIGSGELVKLTEEKLGWKKSTTYTVLKKLCCKGIFENKEARVKALILKDEFFSKKGEEIIEEAFKGSLPKFISAFVKKRSLTKEEVLEIKEIIENFEEE